MRDKITKLEWLQQRLSELPDNYSLHWSTYPCIEWPWGKRHGGYGHLFRIIDGQSEFTASHRLAYELTFGAIPPGLLICHHCDNPSCFRPIHLFLGNHKQNTEDAVKKRRVTGTPLRGEDHGSSKLTIPDVLEIRKLHSSGARVVEITKKFPQVSHKTIRKVILGITWKSV